LGCLCIIYLIYNVPSLLSHRDKDKQKIIPSYSYDLLRCFLSNFSRPFPDGFST